MDSENQLRYRTAIAPQDSTPTVTTFRRINSMTNGAEHSPSSEFLKLLHGGTVLMVNSRRRNGLILFKRYHAEFAGPGAAVGGYYDMDCQWVLPLGNLSLLTPESHEERQKAYLIRRQWVRLTRQITENGMPQQRVQMILNQFEHYFDPETVAQLPDEAFAMLVGVLPQTVKTVRRSGGGLETRGKNY
jgi:hypothetical protein